jgi:hypothetical protein
MQQAQRDFLQDLHMRIARLESKAMEAPANWRNVTKELIEDTPRPSFYSTRDGMSRSRHSTAEASAEAYAEPYAGQYAEQYEEQYAETPNPSRYRRIRPPVTGSIHSTGTVRGHRNTQAFTRTDDADAMDNIHAAEQRARVRAHTAEISTNHHELPQTDRVFIAELVRHVLDQIKLKHGVHGEVAGVHFETDPVNHNIFLVKHSAQIRAIRKLHARMPFAARQAARQAIRTQLDKRFGEGALTQAQIAYVHELVMRDIE